jgi:hypothetical protein
MRLITRSDFDGLVCAAILEELGIVDDIQYVHPKDIQDGKVAVSKNDVLANVPFADGCGLWFDHHSSETERRSLEGRFEGSSKAAPSAARVIFDYYKNDPDNAAKMEKFDELLMVVDIADSARFTPADIETPEGWMLLAFIADPRTGLGHHKEFRISNFDLMKTLPSLMRTRTVEEILDMPDFVERVDFYRQETDRYRIFIKAHARMEAEALVLDFRGVDVIPAGNRFLEYVLFPEQNISVRVMDGRQKAFAVISVGHSIINRGSAVDVGSLMLQFGGGGHQKVGTCQVPYDRADDVLEEILAAIKAG